MSESEPITIISDDLIELSRFFSNSRVGQILDILMIKNRENKNQYISIELLNELTRIPTKTIYRYLNQIKKYKLPLMSKKIIEEKTETNSLFSILDDTITNNNSDKKKKKEVYTLLDFKIELKIRHHNNVVDNSIDLPTLELEMMEISELSDLNVFKFLSKLKYNEFLMFMHSISTSGILSLDGSIVNIENFIDSQTVNLLSVGINNYSLFDSLTKFDIGDLNNTLLFDVKYKPSRLGLSKFKLNFGSISFQIYNSLNVEDRFQSTTHEDINYITGFL